MQGYEPDEAARLVLMSAYLYYCRNEQVLDDLTNDSLCNFVADNWDWIDLRYLVLLDPLFQGPEEIRATSHHVKWTRQVEGGAIAWLKARTGRDLVRDYGNTTLGFVEGDWVTKQMKIYERKVNDKTKTLLSH